MLNLETQGVACRVEPSVTVLPPGGLCGLGAGDGPVGQVRPAELRLHLEYSGAWRCKRIEGGPKERSTRKSSKMDTITTKNQTKNETKTGLFQLCMYNFSLQGQQRYIFHH